MPHVSGARCGWQIVAACAACLPVPLFIEYPAGERVEFLDRWYGEVGSESEPRTVVFAPPGVYRLEEILGDGLVSAPVTIRVRAAE